ncbi:hypothetical protein [Streptomyces sp. SID8499]|uniref:hypothetical protein n=1 Tax=Streptomyces sp. SID8499 TaxID=2706106 RepID=UPI0013CB2FDB|nr:hypothetical protein [Streptomyces sp. SID8499]NED31030.1 hypothetical protein [Streptomyces sp. SID8499]
MTTDQTDTGQAPSRDLLDTLLERWQEVADAYKNDPPRDDLDQRYADYRHIYLRNIRDLRHVLDTGRMPCSLMNDDERRRGDCGRNHEDEHDKHGTPAQTASADDPWTQAEKAAAREPWGPGITRDQAMANIVTLHLAEALLDGKSEEVRTWARSLAHELRRERIDLIDDIGRHMQRMALGEPANEVPF